MVHSCAIKNCPSVWIPNSGISFFKFPLSNLDLLEKWMKVIPKEVLRKPPTVHSRICSRHFLPQFLVPLGSPEHSVKKKLRQDAIPTIFIIDGELIVSDIMCEDFLQNDKPTNSTEAAEQERFMWDVSVQTIPILFKSPAEEQLRKEVKTLKYRLYHQELQINSMKELLITLGLEKSSDIKEEFTAVQQSLEKHMKNDLNYPNNLQKQDFSTACRICLLSGKTKSILNLTFDQKNVKDLVEQYFSIKIEQTDKFLGICLLCYLEIVRAYIFHKKCKKSTEIMETLFGTNNSVNEFSKHFHEDDSKLCMSPIDSDEHFSEITSQENQNDSNCKAGHIKSEENNLFTFENKTEIQKTNNYKENLLTDSNTKSEKDYLSDDETTEKDTNSSLLDQKEEKCEQATKKRRMNKAILHCNHCNATFNSYIEYRKHRVEVKHPKQRKHYPCNVCNKHFTSSKLKQHMRIHTKEQPYECNICLKRFNLKGNLNRHQMIHTGERPHICELCGKGFIQSTTLNTHKRVHFMRDASSISCFSCNICGRTFKRVGPYNKHLRKKHSEEKFEEEIKKEEARDYVCTICNSAFKQKHHLNAHKRIHGERKYLCNGCGKSYATKPALDSHLKVHTGEKPYKCLVCGKSFAHISTFDSHMLTHTGEKPHVCKFCPKRFTQLTHLTYHLRTHSGERPYSCTFCGKCFALKGNLTVHVRMHTGETPYICSVCNRGFYDSNSMKKHKRAQHRLLPKDAGKKLKNSTTCERDAGATVEVITSSGDVINTTIDDVIVEFGTS